MNMRDIPTYLGYAFVLALTLVVMNGNSIMTRMAIAADRAEDAEPVLGFSGYDFGDTKQFILADMKAAGLEAREITDGAIWYESELLDYEIQLGYIFQGGRLGGGAWLIIDASEQAFNEINEWLNEIYGGRIQVTVEGAVTVQVHQGVDALILHTLDRDALTHEVAYMEIE